jgi:hypothetical protein
VLGFGRGSAGREAVSGEGLTELLRRWSAGDRAAAEQAMALAYDELKSPPARVLPARERAGHNPAGDGPGARGVRPPGRPEGIDWQGAAPLRGFFAHVSARVLVDHARERNAAKARRRAISP